MSGPRPTLDTLARGDRLATFTLRVGAEEVAAYLDATGESGDAWTEHVPPLAIVALALGELMARVDLPPGSLHTGQECRFDRLVRQDEPLEVEIEIASRSERRGAVMSAVEIRWRAAGTPAGSARATVITAADGAQT